MLKAVSDIFCLSRLACHNEISFARSLDTMLVCCLFAFVCMLPASHLGFLASYSMNICILFVLSSYSSKVKSVEDVRFSTYNSAVQTDSSKNCDSPL